MGTCRLVMITWEDSRQPRPNWSAGRLLSDSVGGLSYTGQRFYVATFWLNNPRLTIPISPNSVVGTAPATSDRQIVNGETQSVIIESQGDSVWMRKTGPASYAGTRLGTKLTPVLTREFWRSGASSLLDATFQGGLQEIRSDIGPVAGQGDATRLNPFHSLNPCLTYFRETFFHIPFLVANHLNGQQDFAETQRYYHYIFDPTAATGDPWRYREFRELPKAAVSLRKMLTDPNALEAYRKNPFSPHAIARTRLSAYQKSILMKYIDNLLDWGDNLFNQFTMESINEATMLYVMAQDILGPRPRMLGSCGEGKLSPKTYRTIGPLVKEVNDFLVELESPAKKTAPVGGKPEVVKLVVAKKSTVKQTIAMAATATVGPDGEGEAFAVPEPALQSPLVVRELKNAGSTYWTNVGGTPMEDVRIVGAGSGAGGGIHVVGFDSGGGLPAIPGNKSGNIDFLNRDGAFGGGKFGVPGGDIIKSLGTLDIKYDLHDKYGPGIVLPDKKIPIHTYDPVSLVPPRNAVFCIPPNKDLLAYWGRVEDRLFKIRNCMDIAGVRRNVELFAPEIDPRLLVRMTAAGLSLEDVLNSTSGNLPPYRFTYLIDKAKQYTATVQSFGSQLLSAIEKRDGEELGRLRAVHEQNLLKMRTKLAQLEIGASDDTLESLRNQKSALQYRQEHFRSLLESGQNASERKQQLLHREAAGYRTQAGIAQVVASLLTIIPDIGAPTSMKFGGSQLGASGRAVAEGLNALAAFNETGASMAGTEASNQRRDEEWKHQIETAKLETAQIDKNIAAAEIRRDMAVHSLEVHERTIDQTEEMFEFFRDKFSSIDRYRLLSKELRRLYRAGFNSALSMARMAEQAFRVERSGTDIVLSGNYWDAGNAGLLAGERLLIDLQRLEQEYIEGNYRQLEIEQSFSLAQFGPQELDTLRRNGECQFKIPEWFFDLSYPGQYRRRLKAVRMTVPCVVGPLANVAATLGLDSSSIRMTPGTEPISVPLRHTVTIAASKGQYDAGVFDFSFRDERFMPFEGAGAIGTWHVSLPKALRVFDYGTISDIILHLSYTAEFSESLKARWDGVAHELIALLTDATKPALLTRLFSLRNEFPDAFHRLVNGPVNMTEVSLTIESRHFPLFLTGRSLKASTASLQVISSLPGLQGTTLAVGRKVAAPALQRRCHSAKTRR